MVSTILAAVVAISFNSWAAPQVRARAADPTKHPVVVYRVETCRCCGKWAEHLKQAGFPVTVHVVDKVETVKGRERVPEKLRTCHVAFVGPYVVEGHVPADVVTDLLTKRPAGVDGIAVPGMPLGSPGMEAPTPEPYEVITFDKQGRTSVFAKR